MVKRSMAWLLAGALALSLAACGDKKAAPPSAPSVSSSAAASSSVQEPPSQPQAQTSAYNALTGLPAAEGMLEGQRPVGVTVLNSSRALPHRGLAGADVLVEMLANPQETRFLALYADYRSVPAVGPVGATQDQLVQFALPLDSIQTHIGKTQYAANLLQVFGQKDLDGIQVGRTSFWFDEARTLPHVGGGKLHEYSWFTDAALIFNGMVLLDIHTVGQVPSLFSFSTQKPQSKQDAAYVAGWFSDSSWADFYYNLDTGLYEKSNFGGAHTDEDGTRLVYQNVILLSAEVGQKADSTLLEYKLTEGTGWYFTAGGLQKIQWKKGEPQQPLQLLDESGNALQVFPGKSYIGFVPAARPEAIKWQSAQQMADAAAAAAASAPAA